METLGKGSFQILRPDVVSLPMRDGNVTYMTDVAESVIVVSLPMRDGNFSKKKWSEENSSLLAYL